MSSYNVISADSHIVEPPDLYESRIEPKFRSRAPRIERHRTRTGQEYDAWYLDGVRVGTIGSVIQAGRRFEDPGSIDFLGVWEDVRKAAYEPHAMLEELEPTASGARACNRARACSGIVSRIASSSPPSVGRTTRGSRTSAGPRLDGSRGSAC
jgi:hypothetical protein